MEKSHSYKHNGSRWILALCDQTVQVFCAGESRIYDINEPVTRFEADGQYVYIYVNDPKIKYYQFKFEDDQFLVGDLFDIEDLHVREFACHVFGD